MRVGVLGAGQLGQMMAMRGMPLGLQFHFYSPTPPSPRFNWGKTTVAAWDDTAALQQFAASVDVVTVETENVPYAVLALLAPLVPLRPSLQAIAHCQDRLREKTLCVEQGFATNAFCVVDDRDSLHHAAAQLGFPLVLKQRRQGYDGKGQRVAHDAAMLAAIPEHALAGCLAEAWVAFSREVSIIGVRSLAGELRYYDLCVNEHVQGILQRTRVSVHDPYQAQAQALLSRLMEAWHYVGVLTVEMFQCGDTLLVNELAPRVHNSGHWTLDAAVTSQFENHLRAIVGWPLGDTRTTVPCEMHNLVGDIPASLQVLAKPNARFYDYGKAPAPRRKLGHVTYLQV